MDLYEVEKRVNKVDAYCINHTVHEQVVEGIVRAFILSSGAKEPQNILLTGKSGTGKTTVCNSILSRYPKTEEERAGVDVTIVPAFYSLVPSPVTIKGVAASLLSSLGAVSPDRGNALELTYRLGEQLKICETKLIMLDEFQHLLGKKCASTKDLQNWLKTIINQLKVPVVLVGTPECGTLVDSEPQLARRFKHRFRLKNLPYADISTGSFNKYVDTLSKIFKNECQLNEFPRFRSQTEALALYAATSGNPDDITCLLKEATINTLIDEKNSVTMKDIGDAYDRISLPNSMVGNNNPFFLTRTQLNQLLKTQIKVAA